jgi:hypothetical protein
MNFQVVLAPDTTPATPLLGRITETHDPIQLASALSGLSFDLTPPRDNRPFFFNQLPLTQILNGHLDLPAIRSGDGVVAGNLAASVALLVILFVAIMLVAFVIIAPLHSSIRQTKPSLVLSGTAYFLCLGLGLGFMFVEMSLLQRFSVFLGHPAYSLSIVLFAIILSTGLGSLVSEQLKLDTKLSFAIWAATLTAYIACLPTWLPGVLEALESTGIVTRAATTVGIIAPAGLLMGFGFPSGMRMVLRQDEKPAPWFWGINGAAGVLGSILGVAVGITFGIDHELFAGAACYAGLVPAALVLWPHTRTLPIRAVA